MIKLGQIWKLKPEYFSSQFRFVTCFICEIRDDDCIEIENLDCTIIVTVTSSELNKMFELVSEPTISLVKAVKINDMLLVPCKEAGGMLETYLEGLIE